MEKDNVLPRPISRYWHAARTFGLYPFAEAEVIASFPKTSVGGGEGNPVAARHLQAGECSIQTYLAKES